MKFLWSNMSLGGLYTDADADDDDTRRTEHDCIGSLPNEPKSDCKRNTGEILKDIQLGSLQEKTKILVK